MTLQTIDKSKLALQRNILLYQLYKRNKLKWLQDIVKTFDEHDDDHPIKSFPIEPYVPFIIKEFEEQSILHIAKSRQMSVSWLMMALLLHTAQFTPYRLIAVFSKKEKDAHEMVERAKFMYSQQPQWLKDLCPLDRKLKDLSFGFIAFAHGSKLSGFAEGPDQVRGYVPTISFLDEAAKQDKLEETYGACVPCSKKIVTVSSADVSYFEKMVELVV
jgi:hypothetical protein